MFFHAGLARGGRLSRSGSIPSRQLYPDTKFPPGHRSSGVPSFPTASSVSARHPFTLSAGISDNAPIRNDPLPFAVMLSVTWSQSGSPANSSGYDCHCFPTFSIALSAENAFRPLE
jgi:hypothetical protein